MSLCAFSLRLGSRVFILKVTAAVRVICDGLVLSMWTGILFSQPKRQDWLSACLVSPIRSSSRSAGRYRIRFVIDWYYVRINAQWPAIVTVAFFSWIFLFTRHNRVNNLVHKCPPLVPVLSQINSVHAIPVPFKIHFNIVLLGLQRGLFAASSPSSSCVHFSSPLCVAHTSFSLPSLIL